jgi:Carboxypeptidase regulatory-like domain
MLRIRTLFGGVAVLALLAVSATSVAAQGVTTGGLTGIITDATGLTIESAQIQVRNPRTGYNIGTASRASGLFTIQGIEPNSGYIITVRRIGYAPMTRDGIVITLGQTRREDFKMVREVQQLGEVSITASTTDAVINASKTGTGTSISDSALRRLPTLNRNFSDFVALVPQVSTTTGFLSGGGVNLRQNSIQIDGAQASDVFGLGTTGQPGSSANAKSIPLDAVKEYQVLLSPFDVRQGNFGGLLINAVTKSGTNEFHGTIYSDTRNQSFSRTSPVNTAFNQQHYSASLGGPIIKDKLFIFGSGELQRKQLPATGSYIGAPDAYVTQTQIDQVSSAISKYGLADAGTGEQIQKQNPNRNAFVRLDAYLPMSTRLVLRHNYASADNTTFSRSLGSNSSPLFGLTSNKYDLSNKSNSSVLELLTNTSSGVYNEFLFNYATISDFRTVPVHFPQITVRGFARTDPGASALSTTSFVMGTEASSQGNTLDQRTMELTDNITIPLGSHAITVGGKGLLYRSINLFGQNSLGSWTFANIDSLNKGVASGYVVSAPAPTDPNNGLATIRSATYTGYIEDVWQTTPTLALTFGVRYDKPVFSTEPPLNPSVLTDYKRETSAVPHEAQISPRFGFNWDVTGDQKNQLRGGVGSFSGPPPFVYLSNAFGNSGLSGFAALSCTGVTTGATSLAVPAFNSANVTTPPTSCAPAAGKAGATLALGAAINTIDPKFKNPKYLKATTGFDHRFANGLIGTIEGLYTKSQNNAFYQNLALIDTATGVLAQTNVDRNGRVLYGTLTATGSTPKTYGSRTQVLDLTNSQGDYTWSVTGQIQKSFTDNFDGSVAYTHQEARDVVSVTSSTAGSNYRYQRDVSGRLDDLSLGKSKYDQPHRIVATGSYHFQTRTDLSVIYTGNSGAPYDYVYGSFSGTLGDLNADGQTQNDLMYVPKNATDPTEILFTGYNSTVATTKTASQAMATSFENFISNTPCLQAARGTILTRNACRNPWVNEVDISAAQALGKLGGKQFENFQLRADIINFGNLLNKNWGRQAFSDQGNTCGQICSATIALVHTGSALPAGVTTNSPQAQGIFTFDPTFQAFSSNNISSLYTIQISVRYSF